MIQHLSRAGLRGTVPPVSLCSGAAPRSVAAIQAVWHLRALQLPGRYTREVIDVHHQPAPARAARIAATPTLVKQAPLPVQRLVGGFFHDARMLSVLGRVVVDG
jgi:circadian clock protein KaiB